MNGYDGGEYGVWGVLGLFVIGPAVFFALGLDEKASSFQAWLANQFVVLAIVLLLGLMYYGAYQSARGR